MKARQIHSRPSQAGYALLLALVFVGVSLLLLTSLLQWTSGNTMVTDRNNAYNRAVGAAEAATEIVLSHITRDYINQSYDPANLGVYRNLIPMNDWAAEYEFSDGVGAANQTWVDSSPTRVLTNLDSQFAGLYGRVYVCSTRANAKSLSPTYPNLAVAVRQDFQLASIPIFQFAIYYAMDLEINPDPPMKVTGKVHGNADIYTSPGNVLEFVDAVGAVGKIYHHRHPNDPNPSSVFIPVYDSLHQEKVSSLTLPIGTNNSPDNVRQILLEPPPAGESPASTPGKQRYYNKADLILITTDTNWTATFNAHGDGTDFTSKSPKTDLWTGTNYTFLTTNAFWDYREIKTVLSVDIDVARFISWTTTNNPLGRPLKSIYVNDQRSVPGQLTAVRVTNGRTLPDDGLTVATPRPLYVKGDFNESDPKPASLVGDSITILSANWNDSWTSSTPLGSRHAVNTTVNTTVNAAILAGIVPTTNSGGIKHYSGGVENFPRFLEDWNNKTLTYNGSMVVLFPSRYATNFWVSPDDANPYYKSPIRKWAFDVNFLNWTNLPPGTPQVQKLVRGQWRVVAANSPN